MTRAAQALLTLAYASTPLLAALGGWLLVPPRLHSLLLLAYGVTVALALMLGLVVFAVLVLAARREDVA